MSARAFDVVAITASEPSISLKEVATREARMLLVQSRTGAIPMLLANREYQAYAKNSKRAYIIRHNCALWRLDMTGLQDQLARIRLRCKMLEKRAEPLVSILLLC